MFFICITKCKKAVCGTPPIYKSKNDFFSGLLMKKERNESVALCALLGHPDMARYFVSASRLKRTKNGPMDRRVADPFMLFGIA